MNYLIILLCICISIIPIYLIGLFFYKKDTNKEPKKLLKNLFFSGFISVGIVLFISFFELWFFPMISQPDNTTNLLFVAIYSYIFVALIEELSKFLMIYYFGYKSIYFDQKYDIILYSIFVGLGFAFLENIFYIINTQSLTITLLREVITVPAHIVFQITMGYYMLLYKNTKLKKYILLSIIIPIIYHGTYDFLILFNSFNLIILDLLFLIIIIYISLSKVKKIIQFDKNNL